MKKINAVESHKLQINCVHCDSLCQSICIVGITNFVENYFVKITLSKSIKMIEKMWLVTSSKLPIVSKNPSPVKGPRKC